MIEECTGHAIGTLVEEVDGDNPVAAVLDYEPQLAHTLISEMGNALKTIASDKDARNCYKRTYDGEGLHGVHCLVWVASDAAIVLMAETSK